jgi:hypothetical protein
VHYFLCTPVQEEELEPDERDQDAMSAGDVYDTKSAASEMAIGGAMGGEWVELSASRSRAELPAADVNEIESKARIDARAPVGFYDWKNI